MTHSQIVRFLLLKTIGNFLILFAIFGICATFGPALYFEVLFRVEQWRGVKYVVINPQSADISGFGKLLHSQNTNANLFTFDQNQQVMIPKDTNFDILIPKIGANSIVFANVNTADENAYLPILKKGVAQAAGSALPDENGSIFLFAHSTDSFWDVGLYNAVFYLLKDLQTGDGVTLFYKGKRYDYAVTDSKIVDPSDISYLTNSRSSPRQLILQTCWPPGTTWKRLLVIAKPK